MAERPWGILLRKSIADIIKEHKRAFIAGTAVCAAALGVGFFVPVRIEVKQTGTLHQHTALTESDFTVQTSTLFGIKHDANDYKVIWDGWTEEQQEAVIEQVSQASLSDIDEEVSEFDTGLEEYARKKNKNIITADEIRASSAADDKSSDADVDKKVKDDKPADPTDSANAENPEAESSSAESGSDAASTGKPDSSVQSQDESREDQLVVTGDTVTEYTISKGKLTDTVTVDAVPVSEIRAFYDGVVYYMGVPDTENIRAELVYEDGAKVAISCTADEPGAIEAKTDIPVHTEYGDTVCSIVPVELTETTAKYQGKVYSGDTAEAVDVAVTATFADGHTEEVTASEFVGDAVVNDTGDFVVKSIYGETNVQIAPIPITGASIEVPNLLYEEDMLDVDIITLTYADGKTKDIGKGEYELGAEASLPLTAGKNDIPFLYNGKMYIFTVDVLHDTEIRRARMRYADEIATAEYSHLSDTIMVTVNRYTKPEYSYLLTHIIIDDPSQIHAGLSNDNYGGERETPSSAAQRLGWVVGINGSNFDYSTNTPTMADAKIKNGQMMPDSKAVANGMEICLTNSGNLFSPKQGMSINDLLRMGVTDTWCCGDTLLISNGEAVNVGIQSLDYRYPRTAIGMVRPCEYYLITAGTSGYSGGMTYDEVRDTLTALNCGFGKCLDGGGSSTLIFENQMLNTPATGSERPVTDFLYFTE